jgi:hypothetical protein
MAPPMELLVTEAVFSRLRDIAGIGDAGYRDWQYLAEALQGL